MKSLNKSFAINNKGDFPFEYKKGKIVFLNCEINLSKRPFIPRIETEFWVRKAIKGIKKLTISKKQLTVLDIFAGSGCIGIAVLKNIKNANVDFIDIDEKAISQIKINLKLNNIPKNKYKVYKSDLFKNIKNKKLAPYRTGSGAGYDYIFANPPYVALNRIKEVGESVLKYEPKNALFGGGDGLFYIKKFLNEAKKFLNKNGQIYLEIDPFQVREIIKILKARKYKKFTFSKDQFKKYRWVKIWT